VRVYFDTEFLDDGERIHLISLGMVDEDGRTFMGTSCEVPWDRVFAHKWLRANVVGYLQHPRHWLTRAELRDVAGKWLEARAPLELWAYYGAHDHIALTQLWGPLNNAPAWLPWVTRDIKAEMDRLGVPREDLPPDPVRAHDPLEDALWNLTAHDVLRKLEGK